MIGLAETTTTSLDGGTLFWALFISYLLFAIPLALVFRKASTAPWMAFIPVVNIYGLLKTVGRPGWWLILFLIPIVGFVIAIIVWYDLAKSFGHGAGFTIGLVLLPVIFLLILGLGSGEYRGPAAATQGRRIGCGRS